MHYKFIKFNNGDGIIVTVQNDILDYTECEFIEVENPVQIRTMRLPRQGFLVETHVFFPWITISEVTTFKLPTKNILLVTDVKKVISEQYESYINTGPEGSDEQVEDRDDEELSLEEFLNISLKENENEDDEPRDNRRILH